MAAPTEKFLLPSGQEIEKEKETPLDMILVKSRIEENIAALKNFKEKKEDGKSRSEYMELLRNDLKFYYGYNDYLIERFTELFPIDQYVAFFEANEHPRPVTIRTNTLKVNLLFLYLFDLFIFQNILIIHFYYYLFIINLFHY